MRLADLSDVGLLGINKEAFNNFRLTSDALLVNWGFAGAVFCVEVDEDFLFLIASLADFLTHFFPFANNEAWKQSTAPIFRAKKKKNQVNE